MRPEDQERIVTEVQSRVVEAKVLTAEGKGPGLDEVSIGRRSIQETRR